MAIRVLAQGTTSSGTWQIDYDSVAKTVAHTFTGEAPTPIDLSMGVPATAVQRSLADATADLNQGRVIDFTGIPGSAIPPVAVPNKSTPAPVSWYVGWA